MASTLVFEEKKDSAPQITGARDAELGRYIYCVIDCDGLKSFGPLGIGEGTPEVFTLAHGGIAAVISASSEKKYRIERSNLLTHQRVLEQVMQEGHTVLPVRFDTIAEGKNGTSAEERVIEQVLVKRSSEFSTLLGEMKARVEMGIKALWKDTSAIFREIVESSAEIRNLRKRITQDALGSAGLEARVRLGQMVKEALEAKKEQEGSLLLEKVRGFAVDSCRNKTFGDRMFANLALLVEKSRIAQLDSTLNELSDAYRERIELRYVGPSPPCNFVELVISWEED